MTSKIPLPPHLHNPAILDLLSHAPDESTFVDVAEIFSIISDSTRLKILWLLFHSEECVINIAAIVGMSSPAISHHLRILKQASLITSRKEGKEVYYTKAESQKALLAHSLIDTAFNMNCNLDKPSIREE